MMTVEDVFKAFGGTRAVAGIMGVTEQAASNMKGRGSIPARHWPKLIQDAKERAGRADVTRDQAEALSGLTFEVLAEINSASSSESTPAPEESAQPHPTRAA